MKLAVIETIVKGKGKQLKDRQGNLRVDGDGNPILKHLILGYKITDRDNEIEDKVYSKEDAGSEIFQLINKDKIVEMQKLIAEGKLEEANDIYDMCSTSIENAIINNRINPRKDGSEEAKMYLKANPSVIRSLEIPDLVVNALDESGNAKPEYEGLLNRLHPARAIKARAKKEKKQVTKDEEKKRIERFTMSIKEREDEII